MQIYQGNICEIDKVGHKSSPNPAERKHGDCGDTVSCPEGLIQTPVTCSVQKQVDYRACWSPGPGTSLSCLPDLSLGVFILLSPNRTERRFQCSLSCFLLVLETAHPRYILG